MPTEEKDLLYAIIIAAITLAILVGLFIYSVFRQQARYRKLALAKIKAEINTLEVERQRLASDLHDEVGPLLSAIKLQINHIDHVHEDDKPLITKSSQYIDDVIGKIREICNNLLPNILTRRGLVPAVSDFIGKIADSTTTAIHFEHKLNERLPQPLEINMYRILLEVIHNTIKHAEASDLRIQLIKTNKTIRLATEDNGKGFNTTQAMHGIDGHGLLNLQSRAEVMGAEFTFDSKPGKGTRYLFEIPYTN